jgi:thioredoxin 1
VKKGEHIMTKAKRSLPGIVIGGGVVLVVTAFLLNPGRTEPTLPAEKPSDIQSLADLPDVSEHSQNGAERGESTMATIPHVRKSAPGAVQHANDSDFQQKVLNVQGRVLVDFYADWCGPCRMLAPLLEELAREDPEARIVKINVDHSPNLAAQYGIESIPTLIVFENGRPVRQQVGVADKAQLRSMLGR